MRNRGEISGTLFFVIELVLSIVVLLAIGAIVMDMTSSATFFESLFAKDNAYLMETLYSAPNGQLRVGYLLNANDLTIKFNHVNGTVTVQSQRTTIYGKLRLYSVSKAFGTSEATTLQDAGFSPQYYELVRQLTPDSISINPQLLATQNCPDSQTPLTGITGEASEQGFTGRADLLLQDILGAVRAKRSPKQVWLQSGLSLRLVLEQRPDAASIIYYRTGDLPARVACLLSLSIPGATYTNAIPQEYQRYPEQVVIVARAASVDQLPTIDEEIKIGLLSYWGDSLG